MSKVALNIPFDNQYPDNNLKFQHQNDKVFLWISTWNDQQVCIGILECLKNCSYQSKLSLSTLIEPLFHGDFIYHEFDTNHSGSFAYPSTYVSREVKKKLAKDVNNTRKRQQTKVCQLKSMHITSEDDVKIWSDNSILPNIKSLSVKQDETIDNLETPSFLPVIKPSTASITSNFERKKRSQTISNDYVYRNQSSRFFQADVSTRRSKVDFNPRTDPKKKQKLLFQSPSRCTALKRNRIHTHFNVKSAPAAISCHALPNHYTRSDTEAESIFEKKLVGMEITRRHLQTVKSNQRNKVTQGTHILLAKKFYKEDDKKDFHKQMMHMSYLFSQWTEWQKEVFLDNLIRILNPAQIYFLYASIMVSLYRDFISLLPQRIAFKILGYLHPKYLKTCAKVSRKWKWYSEHDLLWKLICERKNIEIEERSTFMGKYFSYKAIKNNWLAGKYNVVDFQGDEDAISATCLDGCDEMVAAGFANKTIRIWKRKENDNVKILIGHQRTIWSVKFISNTLLSSCSSDHTVKIWNIKSGKCIRTIVGHDGAVWSLAVKGERFATGSADKSAKVWGLRTSNLVCSFNNHPGGVYAVCFTENGERLFTGSIDKTLKLWEILSATCLLSIQIGCNKTAMAPVSSLAYQKGYLVCVCGTDFQIFDSMTQQLMGLYTECHKERIESVKLKVKVKADAYNFSEEVKFKILTCGKDGKIRVWEQTRKKPLMTFTLPEENSVYDFLFDDAKIMCATTEGVKILDFNVD